MSLARRSASPEIAVSSPVTLAQLLSALSFALDLTEGARPGHSDRSCLLGMRIGKEIGLSDKELANLYYALLLKDIGCSSNSARIADTFVASDQEVKQNFRLVDRRRFGRPYREALTFLWKNVAPTASVWRRVRQMYRMVRTPGDLTAEVIGARCERGASILYKIGMDVETCAAVYSLDEHWDGQGLPDHLANLDIPILGRICAVAQHLDIFGTALGPAQALDSLSLRAGTWYDPTLVRAAQIIDKRGMLWDSCMFNSSLDDLQSAVLSLDPNSSVALARGDIDLVCSGFADVIDAKSPYLYRHSIATTEAALLMSHALGLGPDRVDIVKRAALLHDLGMLAIPNMILDKAGPLSAQEQIAVHQHPLLTRQILSRVRAFQEVARVASNHHERLDGSGYPFRIAGEEIALESRIIAVADIFTALVGSRPYRHSLSPVEIKERLSHETPERLDGMCVDAVMSILDQLGDMSLEDVPSATPDHVEDDLLFEASPIRFEVG